MTHAHIVNRLSTEKRTAALQKSRDLGDKVRRDRKNPHIWLVSSSTHANVWYRVQDGVSCGCEGFRRGYVCRHLVRVSWEVWNEKRQQRKEAAA